MQGTPLADRIVWCRAGARHRYGGALWVTDDRIRLIGRDAGYSIEVSLAIPFDEIEQISLEDGRSEPTHGERCIVLRLSESAPLVIWLPGDSLHALELIAASVTAALHEAPTGPFAMA